eukprot:gnl/TRDRNA2_/TRDRNA2_156698_c0_seq6.p1 gnl/TRDRNA2_/TRDRNA2_156698_c0~~gnl/TRDRNA2_/TRDRNA2_156698_c0_seq6.p1  ORF type:complete len:343 (+),score=64.00 gnl/TRDRNA2_/TRDRNA2_156698_c0_seq6:70-1098(+)
MSCQMVLALTVLALLSVTFVECCGELCDIIGNLTKEDEVANGGTDSLMLLQTKASVNTRGRQRSTLAGRTMSLLGAKQHANSMPQVAWRAFEKVANAELEKLQKGAVDGAHPTEWQKHGVFQAVDVSLPLPLPIITRPSGTGGGQGDKNIVGLQQMSENGRHCLVYGLGIAGDSAFEQEMALNGCEVHAFDCTVKPDSEVVTNKKFTFHHWCIGQKSNVSLADNNYFTGDQEFQFKSLPDTMRELGHSNIDLLKFDIEGFEWQLFATEILPSQNLPEQLSFELHTQQANPRFVPMDNVKSKDFVAVNKLFLNLYNMGYRVVSKEINNDDPACAEFVLINVHE